MSEEQKAILEHNATIVKLLEKLAELDIDKKTKDRLMLILALGMKAEDGEFVFDKVLSQRVRKDEQGRKDTKR